MKIKCQNKKCGVKFEPEPSQIRCFYCGSLIPKELRIKEDKKSKKYNLLLRFLLACILSLAFFIVMFPFLQRAENLPFEEQAKIGEANLWRIVFFYGFFTSIFAFISFWKKFFRLTVAILLVFWIIGSSLVLFINSSSLGIADNQAVVQQQSDTPTFTGQEVFDAVNSYRKENGVAELKLEQALCNNLAQRYLDIQSGTKENIAHKGFDEWYEKFAKPYGYYVGENFGCGQTSQDIIKGWDGSPGHRLLILDPKNKLGCAYAAEGCAVIILGYKQSYTGQSQNQTPSRTGKIISYHEWCTGKDISIYENELITKKSSDGNIYTMPQGDWDCYENYLKNKR